MPVITLEVLHTEPVTEPLSLMETNSDSDQANAKDSLEVDEGQHMSGADDEGQAETKEEVKVRYDLLEYMMRSDGSVICKLCGEILQSRAHWYRHKYKVHVTQTPTLTPSPLFQCEQCLVFFKSRKGYIGHLASRHSELLEDSHPVLTNAQAEAAGKDNNTPIPPAPDLPARQVCDAKTNTDPELAIPKITVPNLNAVVTNKQNKPTEFKKSPKASKIDAAKVKEDLEEKRSKEEKLVAEIIDRVRRECEAQKGTGGPARRGYSRRTTVMHT